MNEQTVCPHPHSLGLCAAWSHGACTVPADLGWPGPRGVVVVWTDRTDSNVWPACRVTVLTRPRAAKGAEAHRWAAGRCPWDSVYGWTPPNVPHPHPGARSCWSGGLVGPVPTAELASRPHFPQPLGPRLRVVRRPEITVGDGASSAAPGAEFHLSLFCSPHWSNASSLIRLNSHLLRNPVSSRDRNACTGEIICQGRGERSFRT